MPLILDAILIAILVLCTFRGASKGLIRTAASFLGSIISFFLARFTAAQLTPICYKALPLPGIGDKLVGEISMLELSGNSDALTKTLTDYGFPPPLSEFVRDFSEGMSSGLEGLADSVSGAIDYSMAYVIIFIASFIIFLLLIAVISVILNRAAKLPILNIANRFGGGILGFMAGFVVLWALSILVTWLLPLIDASSGSSLALDASGSFMINFFLMINPFAIIV